MTAENPISVYFSIVGIFAVLWLVRAGEAFGVVGDEDASVSGTLQTPEDFIASGGPSQTDVQVCLEGTTLFVRGVAGAVVLTLSHHMGVELVHF